MLPDIAAFQWYFETLPQDDSTAEGYLMDALICIPSASELLDPVGFMTRINGTYRTSGAVSFGGAPLETLISRLPVPFGLYDALDIQSRLGRERSLRELVHVRILGRYDCIPVGQTE